MQIIVIGCGKVGSKLAEILSREGHGVVVIDNDRNAFKNLGPDFNGVTFTGVPIDQDVLKQAGIETADAFAAVTPDDNINIMACQVAREIFKVPKVIARIYNPEREHVFHQFGLDTICPTNITVDVIRSLMLGDKGISNHVIANVPVSFKNKAVANNEINRKLGDIEALENSLIFGIVRKGELLLANPDIRLEEGDELVIAERVN